MDTGSDVYDVDGLGLDLFDLGLDSREFGSEFVDPGLACWDSCEFRLHCYDSGSDSKDFA